MGVKRCIAYLIFVIILLSSVPALAAEPVQSTSGSIQPYYVALNTITSSLSITSGSASCIGQAKTRSSSQTVVMVMELKKLSGGTWVTVASWNGTGNGVPGVTLSKTRAGLDKGYSYVLTVTAKVYESSSLLETVSKDSYIVQY